MRMVAILRAGSLFSNVYSLPPLCGCGVRTVSGAFYSCVTRSGRSPSRAARRSARNRRSYNFRTAYSAHQLRSLSAAHVFKGRRKSAARRTPFRSAKYARARLGCRRQVENRFLYSLLNNNVVGPSLSGTPIALTLTRGVNSLPSRSSVAVVQASRRAFDHLSRNLQWETIS